MALTEGDKAIVKEIAYEVSNTIVERLEKAMDERLALHVSSCPHGEKVKKFKAMMLGVGIGLMAAGGGLTYVVARMLAHF